MSTIKTIHDSVRSAVNRGNKFDADIVTQTRLAAKFLERNYTFKYMEQTEQLTLGEGESDISVQTKQTLKGFVFVRIDVGTDVQDWRYLRKVDAEDFSLITLAKRPTLYWYSEAERTLFLNSQSDSDYEAELMLKLISAWPTDDSKTHPLIDAAEDLLITQTIVNMSPLVRDQRLMQLHTGFLTAQNQTAVKSDIELRQSDGSHAMGFYTG